jgi:two-component system, LytTR family, response regulator
MIKAIHIEDEKRNVLLLDSLVKQHCSQSISMEGNASNIDDAIVLIKKVNPQLVFLDIELDGGNSFELLDKIGEFHFQVIFITAYNNYAVKAFKYNAIDYLLKPIDNNELKTAVEKALQRINESAGNGNLVELIKYLKVNDKPHKIGVTVHDGVLFVNTEEIIRAEAKGSYCILYMIHNKTVTTSQSLGEIENMLSQKIFLRVHNSWIINTNFLKKYYRGKNGYMEMEDGSTVNVSIRKKGDLLDFLNSEDK